MTFLEICKRVNEITGFQGVINSVDATGYQNTLVTAVKDAFDDIQRYRRDWDWMKGQKTINVGSTANSYTLADLWGVDTPDLAEYRYINYDYERMQEIAYDAYVLIEFTQTQKPTLYAIRPWDKALLISPVNAVYSLDLHYIKTLQTLSKNSDVPRMPARHHQLIVYMAVVKLATFIGNLTLFDTYNTRSAIGLGELQRESNPYREVRKRPIA